MIVKNNVIVFFYKYKNLAFLEPINSKFRKAANRLSWLWTNVLKMFECYWILPPTVEWFLCMFIEGDGIKKAAWKWIIFACLRSIWLAHNLIIFNKRNRLYYELWERSTFLATLWAKGHTHFPNISITDLHHQWDIFIPDM